MDSIANMLTIISNGARTRKKRVLVPYSGVKKEIAELLKAEGMVAALRVQEGKKPQLVITLAYAKERPRIVEAKRLSKPGQRRYLGYKQLPRTGGRPGFYMVSTAVGLLTAEAARKKSLGGELIGAFWSV
jgi:small subunit ribosomal protein S8